MDKKVKDAAMAANEILQKIVSDKVGFMLMVVDDSKCSEDNLLSDCSSYLKICGGQLSLAKGLAGACQTDNFMELISAANLLLDKVECVTTEKSVESEE